MSHTGNCFCGAVEVQVTGSPEGMGYCHCSSCRSWSGGPVNAFTLWKPEAVQITSGAQHVATCCAPDVISTASGFHSVNAFTGPPDHDRHELQWQ